MNTACIPDSYFKKFSISAPHRIGAEKVIVVMRDDDGEVTNLHTGSIFFNKSTVNYFFHIEDDVHKSEQKLTYEYICEYFFITSSLEKTVKKLIKSKNDKLDKINKEFDDELQRIIKGFAKYEKTY